MWVAGWGSGIDYRRRLRAFCGGFRQLLRLLARGGYAIPMRLIHRRLPPLLAYNNRYEVDA